MSVSTSPGATMLTWMPCGRSSFARVSASASIAALPMLYGAPLAPIDDVATDEIITMSPRPCWAARARRWGIATRDRWCGPNAWVVTTRIISSGSVSATARPRDAMPALHTRVSSPPRSDTTASTIAAHAAGSSTDASYARATPPAASIAATVSSAASRSRR